jgi:hypothetical protein
VLFLLDERPSLIDVHESTLSNIDISKKMVFILFMDFIIITNKF